MPIDSPPAIDELCPSGFSCRYESQLVALRSQVEALTDQVRTDALTGLYNFRFLSETLPLEMERAQRSLQSLSLILIDIDHFKVFNDTWGHEAGNQALVHLAKVVLETVRKLDMACRFGGEEFAIILPNTELSQAVAVAERLREQLASSPLVLKTQETIAITVSLGVDAYSGEVAETADIFLQRVDTFLYAAKHEGRNRVAHPQLQERKPTQVTQEEKDSLFDLFNQDEN